MAEQLKKLLITGFEPFGGECVNPSWEAVCLLPDRTGSFELTRLLIPTCFETASRCVLEKARQLQPDVILCVGQAGGRNAVTPEMVAINLRYAPIPDNSGAKPEDTPIIEDGPAAYFSTLPVRLMAKAINERGLNGCVSYSAGAYVCNDTLYTLLHEYSGSQTRVGFIHVPYLPQQAKNGEPGMPLDDIAAALTAAIEVC